MEKQHRVNRVYLQNHFAIVCNIFDMFRYAKLAIAYILYNQSAETGLYKDSEQNKQLNGTRYEVPASTLGLWEPIYDLQIQSHSNTCRCPKLGSHIKSLMLVNGII